MKGIIQKHCPADGNTGRIIDVLSLLFCLGMAWLYRGQTTWMAVWLVGAAMSFASAWLDTTGRMIAWLRTDYVKTVLRVRTAGGSTLQGGYAIRRTRQHGSHPANGSRLSPPAGPARVVRSAKRSR